MRQRRFFIGRPPGASEKHAADIFQLNAFDKIQCQRLNESKQGWYKKEGPWMDK